MQPYQPGIDLAGTPEDLADFKPIVDAATVTDALFKQRDEAERTAAQIEIDPNLTAIGREPERKRRLSPIKAETAKIAAWAEAAFKSGDTQHAEMKRTLSASIKEPARGREIRDWFNARQPEEKVRLVRDGINGIADPKHQELLESLHHAPEIFGLVNEQTKDEIAAALEKTSNPALYKRMNHLGLLLQVGRERHRILNGHLDATWKRMGV